MTTPGFHCTMVRPKCGTGEASPQWLVKPPTDGFQGRPCAVVWRGDTSVPTPRQGLLILGTPVGHDDFVRDQLRSRREKHDVLLQRISAVPNLQAAWLLLILRCGSSKFHIEDSPSCIGGRVRSLTQSRHLDMSGEHSWHRRSGSV